MIAENLMPETLKVFDYIQRCQKSRTILIQLVYFHIFSICHPSFLIIYISFYAPKLETGQHIFSKLCLHVHKPLSTHLSKKNNNNS